MNEGTAVQIPVELVKKAQDVGLDVEKSCELGLERRIEAVQNCSPTFQMEHSSNIDEYRIQESATNCGEWEGQSEKEFLKDFGETCRVDWNLAESTVRERIRYARKLIEFLGGHPLEADKNDLREFIQNWSDDNAIKTVRVIYGRYFDSNLADSFKVPQPAIKPKKIPSKKELQRTFENIEYVEVKTAFIMWATSGLRRKELLDLSLENIDLEKRMLTPERRSSTKNAWVTFYNDEAEEWLLKLIEERDDGSIFNLHPDTYTKKISEASENEITPQNLRQWFAEEMTNLGVSERYVDAFCGRTPKSELGRHYSDYSPNKMKERYEATNLKVLE